MQRVTKLIETIVENIGWYDNFKRFDITAQNDGNSKTNEEKFYENSRILEDTIEC